MQPNPTRYQVIIVGAGPAGLATGLHLARRAPQLADEMLILEAKQHPRAKLCGGAVTFHGEEQLQALGLTLADVPSYTAHRVRFQLGNTAFTVPHDAAMRIFDRAVFDAALADAADARGLRIQSRESLLDVTPVADGVEIETSNGRYHARVLVAADGAKSTVRRKLRLFSTGNVARLLRVMTPLDPENSVAWQSHTATFDFTPAKHGIQGYVWHFPCYYNGAPTMNRGIFDSRLLGERNGKHNGHANGTGRPSLKQYFMDELDGHAVSLDDVPLEGHPVRWFDPNGDFARPHVLLTGDAAGVDPLFAEGISYAMEYGAIAAAAIHAAFQREDFSFADYRARLLEHRLGKLLRRRTRIARAIYRQDVPALWSLLFRLADYSPRRVQHGIGSWMAVLPPSSYGH